MLKILAKIKHKHFDTTEENFVIDLDMTDKEFQEMDEEDRISEIYYEVCQISEDFEENYDVETVIAYEVLKDYQSFYKKDDLLKLKSLLEPHIVNKIDEKDFVKVVLQETINDMMSKVKNDFSTYMNLTEKVNKLDKSANTNGLLSFFKNLFTKNKKVEVELEFDDEFLEVNDSLMKFLSFYDKNKNIDFNQIKSDFNSLSKLLKRKINECEGILNNLKLA